MFEGYYKSKRVLVTGHTGFKGSWLSQWLVELGATVGGFSIDIPTNPSLFQKLNFADSLIDGRGDINNQKELFRFFADFKPQTVFHLAAQPLVRSSYDDPSATFATNVVGTINVLEAIRKTPSVRNAIMVTSDKCYENREWEYGYRENDRLGGKDPYSASKGCAEIAISSYFRSYFQKTGAPLLASVRAGNVIGGGDWAIDRIVPDAMRAWTKNTELIVRNPRAVRPWQHVLEPLSGYLWLGSQMEKYPEKLNGEAFNFGPTQDSNRTVADLLDSLRQTWPGKSGIRIENSTDGKNEAGVLKLNCEKAWERLGWSSCLSFKETSAMTVEGYLSHQKNTEIQVTKNQIRSLTELAASKNMKWAT